MKSGNIYIWIGNFQSKAEFNEYMDQSKFRHWWVEHDEDNLELSSKFCKELHVPSYDEDFMIMKFVPDGISELLKLLPADTESLQQICKERNINQANAGICYNIKEDITSVRAKRTKRVFFLGNFEFQISKVESTSSSLAGLRNMIWIGSTSKSKKEFLQYFNQDDYMKFLNAYNNGEMKKRPSPNLRCQFCKDIGVDFYYPEFLNVFFSNKTIAPKELIQNIVIDKEITDSIFSTLDEKKIKEANCAFNYIPNGFHDKKKDQNILIFERVFIGRYTKPKKYIDELDNYNDLTYLGSFMWD